MSRFFLTTAIDYVNSPPHLGTAYEKICADVIARYKRLCGIETRFLMGNDEHSQNVFKQATEAGLAPLAYCDQMEQEFVRTWRRLDVSFDDFIRTTEQRHKVGVSELINRIHAAGDIYEGVYEGWYCVGCEAFKQEKDLVDGRCPLHLATTPQWIREKNHFFRLSKYQQPLLEHFAAHPDFLQPEIRRNEILNLLKSGLEDISVSRAGQSWGIPIPFDKDSVVYVWFDALTNYASAVGLGGTGRDAELFAKWWPADLHVVGKDITRFHAVIWPAMLMAAGVAVPRHVFGHGFMTMNGQRMSKSLGTIVDPVTAANRHGVDPLRLYLVKEIPFGGDGDFSWERYDELYNADLANNLGNLVSRVTTMAARYCGGALRPTGATSTRLAEFPNEVAGFYGNAMSAFAIHEAAAVVFRLINATNLHIAETEPWGLAKDPSKADRLMQVLFDAAEAIRLAAVLLTPIMPASAKEILRRVGAGAEPPVLPRDGLWRPEGERLIAQDGPLWPRYDKQTKEIHVSDQSKITSASAAGDGVPPVAAAPTTADASTGDRISIDDFMKVDLRVAKVVSAERVEKSKKLLKLQVDVGSEQRTLVAGIAEAYEPDALVGRSVVVVFNLRPAKLMGIESNGMVLAASPDAGKPEVVTFANPPDPGTRVR